MLQKNTHLFRTTSLQRLSSPECLDQAVQLVNPKDWLPLGMLGLLIFAGLLWSVFGRLPITVTGQGVLINPGKVNSFQSPIAGQLKSLQVHDGQCVAKDQILATIEPSELKQRLQQQQNKLTQLQQQTQDDQIIRSQRTRQEQATIAAQRIRLGQQMQAAQALAPKFQTQGEASIAEQRSSLQQQLADAEQITPLFEKRFQNRRELAQSGVIAQDTVLQAEQEYRQSKQKIIDLKAQLKQLDFQAIETQQQALTYQSTIAQLQSQSDELTTHGQQLEQDNLEYAQIRDKEIQDVKREIAQLMQQVVLNSQIKSPQAGCIVEISASVGQVVSPGTRLGILQASGEANRLISSGVVYFVIKDGKQVQPGMQIFITPDAVKRERVGSIVGTVRSVSPLAVTRERAASVIENSEVVDKLLAENGGHIEVIAQLNRDASTYSGYQWSSSKGPNLKFTSGATFTARVLVEERSPITFLLPMLREWSGITAGFR